MFFSGVSWHCLNVLATAFLPARPVRTRFLRPCDSVHAKITLMAPPLDKLCVSMFQLHRIAHTSCVVRFTLYRDARAGRTGERLFKRLQAPSQQGVTKIIMSAQNASWVVLFNGSSSEFVDCQAVDWSAATTKQILKKGQIHT